MRRFSLGVVGVLVVLILGSGCPRERPEALLEAIAEAHEAYDLERFYTTSKRFLLLFPEHPDRDRVRYTLAEQIIAASLLTPGSARAVEARLMLDQARREARTENDRFDASILLLKFTPSVDVKAEAGQMITSYPSHPDLDQVYFWAISALTEKRDLEGAAKFSKALLERSPELENRAVYDAIIRRSGMVGQPAPFDEETRRVITSRIEGRVVLVDFWATWCPPCVAAFPEIKAYHAANAKRGFEVVQVSLDEDQAAYTTFLETHPHVGVQLRTVGDDGIDERFGVRLLPAYFLLGRDGRVLQTNLDRATMFERIDEALADDDAQRKAAPSPR